jgi:integrase
MDGFRGTIEVRTALLLSPLLFQRPGEIRQMQWSDLNFETAEWRYTVTKTKTPHVVPLSHQAVALLQAIQPITGGGRYVFPSARGPSRPLSENGVRTALRTLGYTNEQMTPHGFRAMARTILDEVLGYRIDWIEHQLAHAVKDPNGRAYNRTAHLEGRKEMMQAWADYLDKLRNKTLSVPTAN